FRSVIDYGLQIGGDELYPAARMSLIFDGGGIDAGVLSDQIAQLVGVLVTADVGAGLLSRFEELVDQVGMLHCPVLRRKEHRRAVLLAEGRIRIAQDANLTGRHIRREKR